MTAHPMPQRALRSHKPQRTSPRAATTGEHLARLAPHLTERDRWLAHMLCEHKVLTTHQIAELAWPTLRAANLRLRQLYTWRVIDRFQPFTSHGSAPMHYVLDLAGATILAREHGLNLRTLDYRHDRAMGIAYSLRLAHTLGTNTFFTALAQHSRRPGSTGRLTAWWSETRCYQHFGDITRPDAYGRWREQDTEFEWFLEFDLGTERPASRLAAKLPGYAQLAATTGITTPTLIHLPTADRETRVRRALAAALALLPDPALVPVATASPRSFPGAQRPGPAGACWSLLNPTQPEHKHHLSFAELSGAWPHLAPVVTTTPIVTADSVHRSGTLPPPAPLPPAPARPLSPRR